MFADEVRDDGLQLPNPINVFVRQFGRYELLARETLFRSGRSANQRQAEQRAFLISAGCKLAQGYYFGEPVSADRASALLQG